MKCLNQGTEHNRRFRFTNGYFCEDCQTFFPKDSPTYRRTELLSQIWCVLNNINCDREREDLAVTKMMEEIGIGENHDHDYEELISKAEVVMKKYKKTSESATLTIS
jgi:hypothetical protein